MALRLEYFWGLAGTINSIFLLVTRFILSLLPPGSFHADAVSCLGARTTRCSAAHAPSSPTARGTLSSETSFRTASRSTQTTHASRTGLKLCRFANHRIHVAKTQYYSTQLVQGAARRLSYSLGSMGKIVSGQDTLFGDQTIDQCRAPRP